MMQDGFTPLNTFNYVSENPILSDDEIQSEDSKELNGTPSILKTPMRSIIEEIDTVS